MQLNVSIEWIIALVILSVVLHPTWLQRFTVAIPLVIILVERFVLESPIDYTWLYKYFLPDITDSDARDYTHALFIFIATLSAHNALTNEYDRAKGISSMMKIE